MNTFAKSFALAFGVCLVAPAQIPDKRLEVSPGQNLEVKLETGGSIRVRSGADNAVTVKTKLSGRDADQIRVSVERSGNGVVIVSKFEGKSSNRNGSANLEITVPVRFDLDLKTMGGSLEIDGVEGNLRAKTMGGSLDFTRLKGKLNASTMGGSVTLSASQVDGKVSTMGGSLKLKDVVGDLKGSTMGGSITSENVQRTGKAVDDKDVALSTMGGDISVPFAPTGAQVKTMGGKIHIGTAKDFVKASTMGGEIEVKELDGGIAASTMGGNITVTMVGDPALGKRDVKLESKGGQIHLTLPAGLSMEVDVELDYTKNSSRSFKIDSEFPLTLTESPDWSEGKGGPRKTLKGTASFGGGKHKVVIRTTNGNVIIKKKG